MTKFTLVRDANNLNTFARVPSDKVYTYELVAGVNRSITPPAGARVAVFSCTNHFYAKCDGAAAEPSGALETGAGSELNPAVWDIGGKTTVQVIAPENCELTVSFYEL